MTGCPDEDCKKSVQDLKRFVYGDGPGEDLFSRSCKQIKELGATIKNWQDLWSTRFWRLMLATIVSIVVGGYGLYYKAESAGEGVKRNEACYADIREDVDENQRLIHDNDTHFRLIQQQVVNINKQIGTMKSVLNEINKKLSKDE